MNSAPDIDRISQPAAHVRALLEDVTDPEIPVLTIGDLGIVRDVTLDEAGAVTVTITPTYSGCPAMTVIEVAIRDRLMRAGFEAISVKTVLAPAWTTDWLSDAGRTKLEAYGIAPPVGSAGGRGALFSDDPVVRCPKCGAGETEKISEFGSTACKAHYRCRACDEPFDYFKCL
jgi:ring-1,2-phenylacetyl-CoA epoxidase subunit PaaD